MKSSLIIVDDNQPVLESLRIITQGHFDEVLCLSSPDRLHQVSQDTDVDVVLLDMNFRTGQNTGQEGLYWLSRIREVNQNVSVVFITAYGEVDLAVEALKRGASDFVTKPWSNSKLIATLQSAARLSQSKKKVDQLKKREQGLKQAVSQPAKNMIGISPGMIRVKELISKVAKTDANVLILGENGTGKELVAQQIHCLSKRKQELLVSVDLGAIPAQLFESELFGHTKGAFTDAKNDRMGKFEAASGGTLFLDEIGNLPLPLQPKLLAALQNRLITKLGSNDQVPVDIRLISATNSNPQEMVENGLFREDLLYRINTIVVQVPPLRDRREDIPLLARFFLKRFAEKYDRPVPRLTDSAFSKLGQYHWPGNVRELQHLMERTLILADGHSIPADQIVLSNISKRSHIDANLTLEEMEKRMIERAIERSGGNISEAAKQLGITRQTLYNKLKKES